MELPDLPVHVLRRLLEDEEIIPMDIVDAVIERIEERESNLNAYIEIFAEDARKRAVELEDLPKQSWKPLFGIPIAIKDNIVVKGYQATCGSRILLGYKSPYNATAVKKILDSQGIIIGKTNLDEFAMGATGEFSYFGPTRNPLDESLVPGGSSSGSAAAVASGEAIVALGSDTGGSVRQPAAFTGIVGFKPTYGRISRYGLVAFASSLDQIGILSKDVKDSALVFTQVAGFDPMDSTSFDTPVPPYDEIFDGYREYRPTIGIPHEYFETEGLDNRVRKIIEDAIQSLKDLGCNIKEISLPHTKYAVATYQLICTSEASSNLARYDGVRYGFRAKDYNNLEEMYKKTRNLGFGPEVKRRILLGTFALSSGYYDQYYLKALKVRRKIKQDFDNAFEEVDVILGPVSPVLPPKIGEKVDDPLALYLMDIYTVTTNLAGLPAISLPAGKTDEGFPVGMQLTAPPFEEQRILELGRLYEENVFPSKTY